MSCVYFGQLVIDGPTRQKLHNKHNITFEEVKAAIQWPARPRVKWEDHPYYGRRVVALGEAANGEHVLWILKPLPEHDEHADTWEVKTARWLRQS